MAPPNVTELAPPPPPPPDGAKTPSPTQIREARTPTSPPSKRRRERSTPPPSSPLPSSPRQRGSSTPPSPTRGKTMSSEVASHSVPNRRIIRTKLDHSQDSARENDVSGPVAIFWDIENCNVPNNTAPIDIYHNVRTALGMHRVVSGDVSQFSAYGDFNLLPTRIKEDLTSCGIQVVQVSHNRKKAKTSRAQIHYCHSHSVCSQCLVRFDKCCGVCV
ncbi:unnamed protein product [Urochloa humidicola]